MKKIYFFLFGMFMCLFSANSQQWHIYTPQNTGLNTLGGPYVDQIFQKEDGTYVFLSNNKLATFDGNQWGEIPIEDRVYSIFKFIYLSDSELWLITEKEVIYKNGDSEISYTPVDTYLGYKDFTQDEEGNIWLSVGFSYFDTDTFSQAVAKFDGTEWTVYGDSIVPVKNLRNIIAADGKVYIGSDSGLIIFDRADNWQVLTTNDGLVDNDIKTLYLDDDGNLWIGTPKGLNRFNGTSFDTFYNPDTAVYKVYIDPENNIWCYTGKGVQMFDGINWHSYTEEDGLPSNKVYSFYKDSEGNMWFGTDRGLAKLYDGNFVVYSVYNDNGLINDSNFSIIKAPDGTMYISGFYGTNRLKDGFFSSLQEENAPKYDYCWSSITGPDGKLYFQSVFDTVLYVYDGENWSTLHLPNTYTECAFLDSQGNLWFGDWMQPNVLKYDGQNFTEYSDPLFASNVLSIAEDVDNNIYFATNYGRNIVKYDGSQFTAFSIPQSSYGINYVFEMFTDRSKNLWFCDYFLGLIKYDGSNFSVYNMDSISYYDVEDVAQDSAGNIWFVGSFGDNSDSKYSVLKMSPNSFDTAWTFYGSTEGLPTTDAYSVAVEPDNNILIGYFMYGLATNRTIFKAVFNVYGQNGAIEGASVQVNGETLTTDQDGKAIADLPNGTYTAIVSKAGYDSDTVEFTIDYSSVKIDIMLNGGPSTVKLANNEINLYPNPSSGTFYINSNDDIESINIYSINGKQTNFVWNKTNKSISIDIPGSYFVEIKTEKGKKFIRKMIVK